MASFYTLFAAHCMRLYTRNSDSLTPAERCNLEACEKALNEFNEKSHNMFKQIYSAHGSFAESVNRTADQYRIPRQYVWAMIKRLERLIAEKRGLI